MPKKKPESFTVEDHAAGVQRLLGILGYAHLRARAVRGAIVVESGPPDGPEIRFRLQPLDPKHVSRNMAEWRVDIRSNGRWEQTPIIDVRGNVVAVLHNDFPWLLAEFPEAG